MPTGPKLHKCKLHATNLDFVWRT